MEVFLAQLVAGLSIGGIYALVAAGMNLLLLVRNIMNYSFAYVVLMATYFGWMAMEATDGDPALGVITMFASALLLTVVTEPLFRVMASRNAPLEAVVVGVGMGMVLTEVMSQFIHQGRPLVFPSALTSWGPGMSHGLFVVSFPQVVAIVVGVLTVVGLLTFLYRSKQGRAFRAMAQDLGTARIIGIPLTRAGVYSFILAGLMAGIAAILVSSALSTSSAPLADLLALKATVVVLVAGGGNLVGGFLLALAVGVAESLTQAYMPGRWSVALVFGILMVAIIARPNGVFGSRS